MFGFVLCITLLNHYANVNRSFNSRGASKVAFRQAYDIRRKFIFRKREMNMASLSFQLESISNNSDKHHYHNSTSQNEE